MTKVSLLTQCQAAFLRKDSRSYSRGMVFYVYFDPTLIPVAEQKGPLGLSCPIGIVRGFEANCFMAEFDDWYVQGEIKDNVKQLEDKIPALAAKESAELADFVKCLKSLFGTLSKRNRFVYCLTSQGESAGITCYCGSRAREECRIGSRSCR